MNKISRFSLLALLLGVFSTIVPASKNESAKPVIQSFDTIARGKDPLKAIGDLIAKETVVMKFYNNRCPSCTATIQEFEQIAQQYQDRATFITLNTDSYNIAHHYSIRTIPHFLIFHDGKVVSKFTRFGLKKEGFVAAIENVLKNVPVKKAPQQKA